MKQFEGKKLILIAYYAVLLFILTSWTSLTSAPSMIMRICYLGAVVLPPIIIKRELLLPVLMCFIFVSAYGFSYSYMPTSYGIYLLPLLICAIIEGFTRNREYGLFLWIAVFLSFVDILTGGKFETITYCFLILYLFLIISDKSIVAGKSIELVKFISIAFSIASLVIVYYYFVYGSQFTFDYGSDSGLERTGWIDANYLSMALGMAIMSSSIALMSLKNNFYEKVLFWFTIVLSFIVMVLLASRGGLLSIAIGGSILLFFSKFKLRTKLLIMLFLFLFIIFLFNNNYFELLVYRIQNDDGTGSGRSEIWKMKFDEFLNTGNLFNYLFGLGFRRSIYLGGNVVNYYCFHNDFLAYLVSYGIVGLCLFIYMLSYPIIKIRQGTDSKRFVIASIIYLASCCMTLNPLSEGHIVYFFFYFYIVLLSKTNTLYAQN